MNGQDLKNSILQMAIQGKLVEQRPEEGTAEELYQQILKAKQKLIAEGNLKKEKSLPEIQEKEIPFEIPESWKWIRLNDVCKLMNGEKISGEKLPYLEAKYLRGNIDAKLKNSGNKVNIGTHVILVDGENSGEVFKISEVGYMGSTFKILDTCKLVYFDYIFYYLQFYQKYFRDNKKGAAIPHLNKTLFKNNLFPLAPYSEQIRIVDKIKLAIPLVEEYGKLEREREDLDVELPEKLKKSILQYAMQGKLVPQISSEGTAEDLYAQILEEKQKLIAEGKLKKEKPLLPIAEDEMPFQIPSTWKWVRLKALGITMTGTTPSKGNIANFGDFIPFLGPGDLQDGYIDYNNKGLSQEGMNISRVVNKDSILQVCIGGSIGKAAIVDKKIAFNQQINSITPIFVNNLYLYFVLCSVFWLRQMLYDAGGSATPIINKSKWDNLLVPLPPLKEQKRIVDLLDLVVINIKDRLKNVIER